MTFLYNEHNLTLISLDWVSTVNLFLSLVRIWFCSEKPLSHPAVWTADVRASLARVNKFGSLSLWYVDIRPQRCCIESLENFSAIPISNSHSFFVSSTSIKGSLVLLFATLSSFQWTVCFSPKSWQRVLSQSPPVLSSPENWQVSMPEHWMKKEDHWMEIWNRKWNEIHNFTCFKTKLLITKM